MERDGLMRRWNRYEDYPEEMLLNESLLDFLGGLSKSIIQGFREAHDVIGNSIEEGIEKSRKKLFIT